MKNQTFLGQQSKHCDSVQIQAAGKYEFMVLSKLPLRIVTGNVKKSRQEGEKIKI